MCIEICKINVHNNSRLVSQLYIKLFISCVCVINGLVIASTCLVKQNAYKCICHCGKTISHQLDN